VSATRDKTTHKPAPFTARMLLASAAGEDHALCSVACWGEGARGVLWMKCAEPCRALVTVPDTRENRLALRNMYRASDAPKELK